MKDIVERIRGLRFVHVPIASDLMEEAVVEIERLRWADKKNKNVIDRLMNLIPSSVKKGFEQMTFSKLEDAVKQWARDRKIIPNSTAKVQLLKTMSELGELADATAKGDAEGVVDGIGDVLVTLIIYAELSGLTLTDCLHEAYLTIKDRRGTLTPEGIFVKEVG
jgi:NTP pyrophosphatase (non-canonical NTP hydrolase)